MKRILISSTALAAVLGGALLLVPGPAQASNARAKFGSMRTALKKLAQEGMLTVSAALNGTNPPTFKVLLDGQPLPPDVPVNVTSADGGAYVDYTVTIDLSESTYQSIKFGKDQNTLELIPKAAPNHRDVVRIDPKTSALLAWSTLGLTDGKWKELSTITYSNYSVPLTGPANSKVNVVTHDQTPKLYEGGNQAPSDGTTKLYDNMITIHMRLAKDGGSATMSVKPNN